MTPVVEEVTSLYKGVYDFHLYTPSRPRKHVRFKLSTSLHTGFKTHFYKKGTNNRRLRVGSWAGENWSTRLSNRNSKHNFGPQHRMTKCTFWWREKTYEHSKQQARGDGAASDAKLARHWGEQDTPQVRGGEGVKGKGGMAGREGYWPRWKHSSRIKLHTNTGVRRIFSNLLYTDIS